MKHLMALAVVAGLSVPALAETAAPPPAAPKADPAKAQQIAAGVCAACHGADGNSTLPVNPSLAGQHPQYTAKQLADFKSGTRKNPVMQGMVANLSPEDMRNLAAYFAEKPPKPISAKDKALAQLGQKLYRGGNPNTGVPACASCHAPDGAGIPAQFPRLAGQHAEYTLAQLKNFRAAERTNDAANMMRTIAARMSDLEMQAVAEYIAGLR
ncbi:MAG TPA: c-type cytochrome [Dehalococcoidia bacterium]|nr:c-type cytochrome [Dehalococcoidia bacterium]